MEATVCSRAECGRLLLTLQPSQCLGPHSDTVSNHGQHLLVAETVFW